MTKKNSFDHYQRSLFNEMDQGNKPSIDHIYSSKKSTILAIVKPEMLIWGRQYANLSIVDAARKIGVSVEKLRDWEGGVSSPTVNQLHKIARIYNQLFAAFYLPFPPKPAILPLKDFRRLPSASMQSISYELTREIRLAMTRRDIALELLKDTGEPIKEFRLTADLNDDINYVAKQIRAMIFSGSSQPPKFKDKRFAFNFFRERVESLGVFVFQTSSINVNEMRGFSINETILPVIVVNRKDSYSGRIFSILHELSHLILHSSGLCEVDPDISLPPEKQQIEIYCNRLAANVLMPEENFYSFSKQQLENSDEGLFSDSIITRLSDQFGVSREAVVRRLMDLGLITREFYQFKRNQYQKELQEIMEKKKKTGGPISPARTIVSLAGKPYISLVLDAIGRNRITLNDASGYLNIRINQIRKVAERIGA